jgi:hypothetical protein
MSSRLGGIFAVHPTSNGAKRYGRYRAARLADAASASPVFS